MFLVQKFKFGVASFVIKLYALLFAAMQIVV